MKKAIVIVLLFAVLGGVLLTACADRYDENGILKRRPVDKKANEETEEILKQAYYDYAYNEIYKEIYTIDDVEIKAYYGRYNGCEVFFPYRIKGAYLAAFTNVYIDDITFTFSTGGLNIYVYHNGEVCTLKEAYENELLAYEDIKAVHEIFIYDKRQDSVKKGE